MNQLQEIELETVEQYEGFKIDSIDSLNWAFRKLAAYQAQKQEIQNLAKNERDRIDYWEKGELKSINDSMSYFQSKIQEYHSQILAEDGKKKTLSTPYGKSKAKTSKAQPEKQDEEKLMAFVEENELDFIKTEKKLQWGELKKALQIAEKDGQQIVIDENGQEVPGAAVKPESVSYSVEIAK